ncbi:hypothetical protein, variant [Aphanomyces invadans]|nr:hypothetical protein, variant [Aphanomyces invadans]ETW01069.1 hypothetical protein, variant [Aphanomyces invadans]|eukprot:XP_008870067.1 hypothetical protein, variant [Aphanomyces invadans]
MQVTALHQRRKPTTARSDGPQQSDGAGLRKREKVERVSLWTVLAWITVLIGLTFWRHNWLPEPKAVDIPLHAFSEGRARVFLEELQGIEGFRTVGSISNEERTPAWLLAHLESFQRRCVAPCQFDIEVQRPTGAFGLNFLTQFQNVYANVTNILVRVQRKTHNASTPAVLLSSHYDAAVGAGAASDDGVNIAIMLELLQNVVASEDVLPQHHALMFNFNGAEETMLQAAHGFITQHPWRDQVVAFINLEASGAGGRELLFQTGSDVLAMAYAKGAPYPHASTIAQEVFQSGVIPGVTDYTVYSEHGDVAGMDFAYVANGYVYHTPLDDISRIQPGAIQRLGENVQGTLNELFADPTTLQSIARNAKAAPNSQHVFFDVLGLFTVTYSEALSGWINYLVLVLAGVYLGIWSPLAVAQKWRGVVGLVKMNAVAFTASITVAGFVTMVSPMPWYASPATHLWMFIFPAIAGYLTAFPDDTSAAVPTFVEGVAMLWMALSALLMAIGVQSAYMSIYWVIFPLSFYVLFHGNTSAAPSSLRTALALLVGPAIPLVYFLQIYIVVLQVFIPIMGRLGNIVPVDFVVAFLTTILTTITLSAITPVLCLVHPSAVRLLQKYSILGSMAGVVVAILSNPYSPDCPKRVGLNHIYRNFSQLDIPDDWGMWVNAFDFRGLEPLRPTFESTKWSHRLHPPAGPVAPITIFDNLPWFYPISHIIPAKYSWYLPANAPDVRTIPT